MTATAILAINHFGIRPRQTFDHLPRRQVLSILRQKARRLSMVQRSTLWQTDAIGRTHQVATVQIDFVQPQRFELQYIDEEGNVQQPIMVHCALLGLSRAFLVSLHRATRWVVSILGRTGAGYAY